MSSYFRDLAIHDRSIKHTDRSFLRLGLDKDSIETWDRWCKLHRLYCKYMHSNHVDYQGFIVKKSFNYFDAKRLP